MMPASSIPPKRPLDAAMQYAAMGWHLFPVHTWVGTKCSCGNLDCSSPAKHPRIKAWQNAATTDPDQLRAWWAAWPDANIGLATGETSGVFVLDVDDQRQAEQYLAERGAIPPSLVARTGGGGYHIFLKHPGWRVRNKVKGLPGMDIRGDGGYVVLAPSHHANGKEYEWVHGPGEREVAAGMPWLLEWLATPERQEPAQPQTNGNGNAARNMAYGKAALVAEIAKVRGAGPGERNDTLNSSAFSLFQLVAGGCLGEADVVMELIDAARAVGLEPGEYRATIESARRAGLAEPRYAPENGNGTGAKLQLISPNGARPGSDAQEGVPEKEIPSRWKPKPISQLVMENEQVPWQWRGYLAEGNVTLLTGLWKSGKSTLLAYLLKALGDGSCVFAGQQAGTAQVLVITEEHERHWVLRRDSLGLQDNIHIVSRPFMRRPNYAAWVEFVDHVTGLVTSGGYTMVVLDTLHNLWPVDNENDAADVNKAIMPLQMITALGASVLLIGHHNKSDSSEGRATRGSGATPGFADIYLEMRRYNPVDMDDTRRVIASYSRYEDTPKELVLEWERGAGYKAVGTKYDVKMGERKDMLVEMLPWTPPGKSVDELIEEWPNEDVTPSKRTLERDLHKIFSAGELERVGKGQKSNPYRYWRVEKAGIKFDYRT